MKKAAVHLSHPEVVKRLKRADGHLQTIIEMLEAKRSCLEIAQQLLAVENAVAAAKKMLVQDHIDHCLEQAASSPASPGASKALNEFKELTKYL